MGQIDAECAVLVSCNERLRHCWRWNGRCRWRQFALRPRPEGEMAVISLVERLEQLKARRGQGRCDPGVRDPGAPCNVDRLTKQMITVRHSTDGAVVSDGPEGARHYAKRRCDADYSSRDRGGGRLEQGGMPDRLPTDG